jgi:hypothetical protein
MTSKCSPATLAKGIYYLLITIEDGNTVQKSVIEGDGK